MSCDYTAADRQPGPCLVSDRGVRLTCRGPPAGVIRVRIISKSCSLKKRVISFFEIGWMGNFDFANSVLRFPRPSMCMYSGNFKFEITELAGFRVISKPRSKKRVINFTFYLQGNFIWKWNYLHLKNDELQKLRNSRTFIHAKFSPLKVCRGRK